MTTGVRIGGHLSIARGMTALAKAAIAAKCESVQLFTRSPRGGDPKPLDPADVAKMTEILKGAGIGPLVVHSPYYVSPANERPDLGELASRIIHEDRVRAAQLGASYVVVHAGHRKGADPATAVAAVVERVSAGILLGQGSSAVAAVSVLVENGAGGRGDAAGDLAAWSACVSGVAQRGLPIGACMDTAHLWAAGILTGNEDLDHLFEQLDSLGILGRLRVIHFNDSSVEAGSRRDKHEHIGEGQIPMAVFQRLLRAPEFQGLCGICETDPQDNGVARDVATLKRLRDEVKLTLPDGVRP